MSFDIIINLSGTGSSSDLWGRGWGGEGSADSKEVTFHNRERGTWTESKVEWAGEGEVKGSRNCYERGNSLYGKHRPEGSRSELSSFPQGSELWANTSALRVAIPGSKKQIMVLTLRGGWEC